MSPPNRRRVRRGKRVKSMGNPKGAVPSKANVDMFRTTITCTVSDMNAGGVGAQAFCFPLNYPTYYRTPAGAIAQLSNVPTSYANEFKMFDEYQVQSLTVEYIPFYNYSIYANQNTFDPTLVVATDNDDSALLTSYAKAINSQGRCIYSILSNRRIIVHQRNQGSNAKNRWGNTGSPSPATPDAITPLTLGSVKTFVPAYSLAGANRGLWVATWDVCYRGIFTSQ